MISRIFLYRLKTILRDREMVFWTMMFPIILATLFRIAFANLGEVNSVFPIPAAVVDNGEYQADSSLRSVLAEVSSGENPMFGFDIVSLDQAQQMLTNGSIYGFIIPGEDLELHVKSSGLRQSILRIFLDQYLQTSSSARSIVTQNPAALNDFMAEIENPVSFVQREAMGKNPLNELYVFYFALLAMACFYGGYYGLTEAYEIQGNLSPRAARINMSPVHKLKALIASSSATLLVHLTSQIILLLFLRFFLQVDFADQFPLVILATLVGSTLSIAMGAVIGTALPGGENFKSGVVTAVSMTGALFAGLMFPQLKYLVAEFVPLLNRFNPVNLLADAYYSLYYFEGYDRYWQNLGVLLIMSGVFLVLMFVLIRRRNYDSL